MPITTTINLDKVWKLYKGSEEFSDAIDRLKEYRVSLLLKYYNAEYAEYFNAESVDDITDSIYCYGISESPEPSNGQEALSLLQYIPNYGICENGEWVIYPGDYDFVLELIGEISYAAAKYTPDYFYPYLYSQRITDWESALNVLGIELPAVPKRSDKAARYEYYWRFCEILGDVRKKYGLTHEETCVFFYDFIPAITRQEAFVLPEPTQCWFIGGTIDVKNKIQLSTTWQVNKDTRLGDILVHYETSPASALTAIWRAESNGCVDPFFHWHTYAQIGHRIDIPHITLSELRQDEYFSTFPLTKKNFQGVNGFPMPAEAYNRLLEIIASKGGDVSSLPKLYAPIFRSDASIKIEKDVEERLIIPLLESLGLQSGRDYKRQMGIHVGTGHRVIPDFAVHYKDVDGEEGARILIEAKFDMSNRKDIDSAFKQARSYALNLKAEYLITCDRSKLLIYTKTQGDFHKDKYTCLSWTDIENPDTFNRLKKVLL